VPVDEIPLVVLIALLVAAQEAVEVSLVVGAAATENGVVAAGVPEKVGALRVVGLPPPRVVRAREEAVPVALVVGVRAVLVVAVVRRLVDSRRVILVVAVVAVVAVVPMSAVAVAVVVAVASSMAAVAAPSMVAVASASVPPVAASPVIPVTALSIVVTLPGVRAAAAGGRLGAVT
jgi:hypothetical protein